MTRDPNQSPDPIDPALDSALAAWQQQLITSPDRAQREAAWRRLESRLRDPSRHPFTDDVSVGPMLVSDEHIAAVRATPARREAETKTPRGGARSIPGFSARRATRTVWAVAAALLCTVGGVGAWGTTSVQHTVSRGATASMVRLPDGSAVWVGAGGALSYPRHLAWPAPLRASHREVIVQGTAFFDVARGDRPFRVRTADAEVQVLGTRFEVRAAQGAFGTRVQVQEGRVAVSAGAARRELTAGEGTTVTATGLTSEMVSAQRVATWRTGGLAALDEPLGAVLDELARRFAVEISADPDVDVQAAVSLFYPTTPGVEVVLGDLCTAQGLAFSRTSRGYRVRGAVRAP